MNYLKLLSLEEAAKTLKEKDNTKVLAGGTDLLVHYRHRKVVPDLVLDIKSIDVLNGIKIEGAYLKIGACTCLNDIVENELVKENFDVLCQAAMNVGCYQVRNRATIGGNICNASPAGDTIPPLYCLDAILTYFKDGEFIDCNAMEFFTGPGKTVLTKDSILCQVKIPMKYAKVLGTFLRHSRRNALDLSTVSVTTVNRKGNFAIALGSVAPTVIRVPDAENILNVEGLTESSIEKASEVTKNSCKPISDLRASKDYRSEMVKAYAVKALKSLMEG